MGNNYNYLTDDVWHHYVVVFDRSLGQNVTVVNIYIDGNLVPNNVVYNTQLINTVANQNLVIGQYWPGVDPRTFIGSIDDVRIYNRVLSLEEISYLATH